MNKENLLVQTLNQCPKVKNLVWRASRECLPTLKQLRIRRVDVQALCPICRDAYESIEHALLLCTQPKLVWDRVGIGTAIAATGASSFLDWCIQSFATADADKRKLLPVLCWAIWSARNDFVWQQKTTTAATILNTATGFLDQWSKAQNTLIETSWSSYTIHDGAEQWVVPSENKIKVNVDAALFNSSNKYGCGFVARDHYVETDCLTVVQALRSSMDMISSFGQVILECKKLLSDLKTVSVLFVKRLANMVAHNCARASILYPGCIFDMESVPFDLLPSLVADFDGY
ncbi:uncharacterized protein LOC133030999 [Cannabis sativa]|uniref:uncharacterized protein LOC133030999 n=1 Tax=Cannabis sativa TaxID=3483 RepID=UPI0029C9C07C|nr:uncharacterized protein LOC133030999 [Cannabis sativa]